MVSRNRQYLVTIIVLGSSMLGCVHRTGSALPKSTVATPAGQVGKQASLPKGDRAQENIDRAQAKIDEVLKRMKQSPRVRSSPTVPPSMTRPDAEPQQPIDTAGTHKPPYNVV